MTVLKMTAQQWMVTLMVLVLVAVGGSLVGQWQQQRSFEAGQRSEQAAQRRAGELVEKELCEDVGRMARIPPPAGPAATNPSRAYEQAENRTWSGLVRVLHCKQAP